MNGATRGPGFDVGLCSELNDAGAQRAGWPESPAGNDESFPMCSPFKAVRIHSTSTASGAPSTAIRRLPGQKLFKNLHLGNAQMASGLSNWKRQPRAACQNPKAIEKNS